MMKEYSETGIQKNKELGKYPNITHAKIVDLMLNAYKSVPELHNGKMDTLSLKSVF